MLKQKNIHYCLTSVPFLLTTKKEGKGQQLDKSEPGKGLRGLYPDLLKHLPNKA